MTLAHPRPRRCSRRSTLVALAAGAGLALLPGGAPGFFRKAQPAEVLPGIDVLEREGFARLRGRKIGLITNHTGLNRDGVSTLDLLVAAPGVEVVALFSPEHGFLGVADTQVADGRHAATGLPIHSLYGAVRKPTPESLAPLDTLVFDIQDIGCRFYTYISTMVNAMEATAAAGKRFVVLDRPNPIGGLEVEGPPLDPGKESFTAYHNVPVRHGMTAGELARMINAEQAIGCALEVVAVAGWRRSMAFDQTGLYWVNPSPNMRSLTQAFLYPGIGLIEFTNVSVGRGTDTPFELVGAPWVDGRKLAAELNAAGLPGVRFIPVRFTPEASKFKGQECAGVNIAVTDRKRFEPVRTGLALACALRRVHPEGWEPARFIRLLGNQAVFEAVAEGQPAAKVARVYRREDSKFKRRRRPYLIYR